MTTTHANELSRLPANRALATKGGSWQKALARAQKATMHDQPPLVAATGDVPPYSLFVPAGFVPRHK